MKPYKRLTPTRRQYAEAIGITLLGGLGAAFAAYLLVRTVAVLLGY